MFSPDNASMNPVSPTWRHIITAYDLIYFQCLDTSKNSSYTIEVYFPYVVARQFGLFQDTHFLWLISFNKSSPKTQLLKISSLAKVKALSSRFLSKVQPMVL